VTIRDDGSIAVLTLRHVVALYTAEGRKT